MAPCVHSRQLRSDPQLRKMVVSCRVVLLNVEPRTAIVVDNVKNLGILESLQAK